MTCWYYQWHQYPILKHICLGDFLLLFHHQIDRLIPRLPYYTQEVFLSFVFYFNFHFSRCVNVNPVNLYVLFVSACRIMPCGFVVNYVNNVTFYIIELWTLNFHDNFSGESISYWMSFMLESTTITVVPFCCHDYLIFQFTYFPCNFLLILFWQNISIDKFSFLFGQYLWHSF